jgi:uncharacterized protein (TIRG00374 family)
LNRKLWISVLISAALLWFSMRDVQPGELWGYIRSINPIYFIPYFVILVLEVVARSLRWWAILRPAKRCTLRGLVVATLIGTMANNVLPARAGEFVRAYAGARIERLPFSTALATIVIDRVLDGLTITAIFALALIFFPLPDAVKPPGFVAAGILAAAAYAVGLVFLIALLVRRESTLGVAAWILQHTPLLPARIVDKLMGALRAFAQGLDVLRSPWLLTACLGLSALIWIGYTLSILVLWPPFDIHLGLGEAFIVLLVLTLGLTLPSTPGFVGAIESAFVVGLGIFGVDGTKAVAFALVYHLSQYIPHTIVGLLLLPAAQMSFREMAQVESGEAPRSDHDGVWDGGVS